MSEMTAPLDLEALAALHAKATAGMTDTTFHLSEFGESFWFGDDGECFVETGHPDHAAAIVALHNAFPALAAELAALRAMEARTDRLIDDLALLDWVAERTNIELFCHTPVYGDDDDLSVEWRVTQVNGCVNDREWTVIGKGFTPAAAIRAAIAAAKVQP